MKRNFQHFKSKFLTLAGGTLLAVAVAVPTQAADREDVVAGVVLGTVVGYALSHHDGAVRVSHRYQDRYPRDSFHYSKHHSFERCNHRVYGNYGHYKAKPQWGHVHSGYHSSGHKQYYSKYKGHHSGHKGHHSDHKRHNSNHHDGGNGDSHRSWH